MTSNSYLTNSYPLIEKGVPCGMRNLTPIFWEFTSVLFCVTSTGIVTIVFDTCFKTCIENLVHSD